jgi:hypothetical protein
MESGTTDVLEELVPEEESSAGVPQEQTIGRWAAKIDAEALAELRLSTPELVARIVTEVLRKQMLAAGTLEFVGDHVHITLSRQSKKATPKWGFRWNEGKLKQRTFVVGGVFEDSMVDKWNLKRMSTGSAARAVYPGDLLIEVNGHREYEMMRQQLKQANELELEFVRTGAKEPLCSILHDETDDEAEELRAALAAAQRARKNDFLRQSASCFESLSSPLKTVFGAASTKRASNGHLNLEDCLDQFSFVEAIEDDYQPVYRCAMCKSKSGCKTFASRRFWLWPVGLPSTLTLQLKRFRRYTSEFVKSMTSVVLPAVLDLSSHVLTEAQLEILRAHAVDGSDLERLSSDLKSGSADSVCYELFGICEHQGGHMQDGHYVAYVNVGPSLAREEWLGISDAKMWKCNRAEVLKVEAYIAFYRRVDADHKADSATQDMGETSEVIA